jgi:hypothetical protein
MTKLAARFEDAVACIREAFVGKCFGVLTEIDVKATLETKLGVDMEDYPIVGACNAAVAYRAINVHREIGPLLPYQHPGAPSALRCTDRSYERPARTSCSAQHNREPNVENDLA